MSLREIQAGTVDSDGKNTLSLGWLSNLERTPNPRNPSRDKLRRLSEYFGKDPDFLIQAHERFNEAQKLNDAPLTWIGYFLGRYEFAEYVLNKSTTSYAKISPLLEQQRDAIISWPGFHDVLTTLGERSEPLTIKQFPWDSEQWSEEVDDPKSWSLVVDWYFADPFYPYAPVRAEEIDGSRAECLKQITSRLPPFARSTLVHHITEVASHLAIFRSKPFKPRIDLVPPFGPWAVDLNADSSRPPFILRGNSLVGWYPDATGGWQALGFIQPPQDWNQLNKEIENKIPLRKSNFGSKESLERSRDLMLILGSDFLENEIYKILVLIAARLDYLVTKKTNTALKDARGLKRAVNDQLAGVSGLLQNEIEGRQKLSALATNPYVKEAKETKTKFDHAQAWFLKRSEALVSSISET